MACDAAVVRCFMILLAVAACGCAPRPPVVTSPRRVGAEIVASPPDVEPLVPPPPIAGPLPPSSARVRVVAAPGKTQLVYVTGDTSSVLALSAENELFVVRGDRIESRGRPTCPEPYWDGTSVEPVFRWARAVGDHFLLRGYIARVGRSEWHEGMKATNEGGHWRCALDSSIAVDHADVTADTGWYARGPLWFSLAHIAHGTPPSAPGGFGTHAWTATSESSAWLLFDGALRYFNGTVWESFAAPPMKEPTALLQDRSDVLWAIGAPTLADRHDTQKNTSPGSLALARMRDGAWSFVATPASFDASLAAEASAGDVWFFGSRWWQWTNDTLQEAPAALAVQATWRSPSGSLWVAGDGLAEIVP